MDETHECPPLQNIQLATDRSFSKSYNPLVAHPVVNGETKVSMSKGIELFELQKMCYIYCRIFPPHEERHEIASKSIAQRLRLPLRCSSKMLFITLKAH